MADFGSPHACKARAHGLAIWVLVVGTYCLQDIVPRLDLPQFYAVPLAEGGNMYGIAGFVVRQLFREYCAPSLAHAMAKHLTHRGPDTEGFWSGAEGCRVRRCGGCGGWRWQ